jgi:hypothetical protein
MKKVFLATILLCSINAFGQDLELGVGGGFSSNSAPDGNMVYIQDKSSMNYAGTLKVIYSTRNYWQFGLDGHVMEISGTSSKVWPGVLTDSVGGDNKKIVYAKYGVSVCGVVNKAFVFKNAKTNTHSKSYVYIGGAIGMGSARNDHLEYTNGETYNAPDGGRGLVLGAQAGYVGNLSEKFGFNLDIAMRHMDFKYDAGAPLVVPYEDLDYSLTTFPITVGIRYFVFRTDRTLVPRYDGSRPPGRSLY